MIKKNTFILAFLVFFSLGSIAQVGLNPTNPEFTKAIQNQHIKAESEIEAGGIPFPVKLGYAAFSSNSSKDFPSSYDLRGLGVLPPVKTQSSGGCWAYSSMSTVESRMLVLEQGLYNLSDNNLKYCHEFFPGRSTNGNAWMATAYFARQSGPLLEEQDPHPGGTSEPGVNCPVGEAPAFLVRESRYPPGDMNSIKQLIMDNGSVWSLIYYNATYFNDAENTYYYGGTHEVNHVFNIVGWDDNKVTDGGVGAWICQNTYGTSWGEDGFVYTSYNDSQFLIYNAYFPSFEIYSEDSRVLLYDELGNYSSYGYGSEDGYALVKYEVTENLFIDKLGTYAMAYGTGIEMEIYSDFDAVSGVLSNQIGQVSAKTTEHPGLYTYALDEPISVLMGSELYIKVKYNTPSYDWPIPVEMYLETYSDPYIESGVAWISGSGNDGDWLSVGEDTDYKIDLCINVYGTYNPNAVPLSNHIIMVMMMGLLAVFSVRILLKK
ncbi:MULTISPECIES: C1 family peptidase [unclassified Lentimicrobium]|uniref:C1 family peptidase n=1 Tax=unclassified Lentimicrobium TaxID=2677434 RepID=UPI0015556630|nr:MULTISPECIES: C1 family peptidase [unclassified Lentimicrobium]NPD46536.1 hypothetical protein [Lentimicrobium sp. S6]NPD85185.1 hypothetical protein [Lentimicrobium sp. L6]